jgi:hypothetical protein
MMVELRKLWYIMDANDTNIRPRYIRSAANIWADGLSRELDMSDWLLNPRVFRHLDKIWGTHSIDRFASVENATLPQYNSRWRDPRSEATDCLRLDDNLWRKEKNWCNPPWELLNELVAKQHSSGAAATVIAPHWVGESCHQLLLGLSAEVIILPPARDLFFPGMHGARDGVGMPIGAPWRARCRSGMVAHSALKLSMCDPCEPQPLLLGGGRAHVVAQIGPRSSARPKYRLQAPTSQAPWVASMGASLAPLLGTDALDYLALALLTSSKEQSAYTGYLSELNHFFNFCRIESITPLDVTAAQIIRYIAYLGSLNTIAAGSMQPYISAINRCLQDHQRQPVSMGPMVVDAQAGLAGLQVPLVEPTRRAALPAVVAKQIHDFALSLSQKALIIREALRAFRDALATVVSFQWFNRSDTTHSLSVGNLTVDPVGHADRQFRHFSNSVKGKKRLALNKVTTISVPVSAHPAMAAMLLAYAVAGSAAYVVAQGTTFSPPTHPWALPGDTPSRWTAAIQDTWMKSALNAVGAAPPLGYTWTSHSLRKGAAFAARAIRVTLEVIRYFGGWAKNGDVVNDYIDPSVRPSPAASFFFGWLLEDAP